MSGSAVNNTWTSFPNSTFEYYVETLKTKTEDYVTARNNCAELGGMLASVTSAAIQQFLTTIIPLVPETSNQTRQYWIGAHRTEGNLTWRWQDNVPLDYSNWSVDEAGSNSTEHCGAILTHFEYEWFDSNCETEINGYVCQRERMESTTVPTTTTTRERTTSPMPQIVSTTTAGTCSQQSTTITTEVVPKPPEQQTDFPVVQVVVPIVVALLVLCGIVLVATLLYKKKYHKKASWEPMSDAVPQEPQPHETISSNQDVEQGNTENKEPVIAEQFTREVPTQFENPTYDQHNSPRKPQPIKRTHTNQNDDEYVEVYSTSTKYRKS